MAFRLSPPHQYAARGRPLRVTVQCTYPKLLCHIDTQSHQPLRLLRNQIASLLAIKPAYTQLWLDDESLRMDKDTLRLAELGITGHCSIEAKQVCAS